MILRSAKNEAETREIAAELARAVAAALGAGSPPSLVIGLIGPLGAGKTAFVRGFMNGLDPAREADVSSPTYALIHVYPGAPEVRHVDLYRLDSEADARGLGLRELVEEPGVTLIEWIDKLETTAPLPRIDIRLAEGRRHVREIQLEARGAALEGILHGLRR